MSQTRKPTQKQARAEDNAPAIETASPKARKPRQEKHSDEVGGPKGLEPTRYGDWERKGRCIDF